MTQRSLLVSALALTVVVGGGLVIATNPNFSPDAATKVNVERCERSKKEKTSYYKNNKRACDRAIANKKKASPTPSTAPTSDDEGEDTESTPTPGTSVSPSPSPSMISVALSQRTWTSKRNKITPIALDETAEIEKDAQCGEDRNTAIKTLQWKGYQQVKGIDISRSGGELVGRRGAKLKDTSLVSDVFFVEGNGDEPTDWRSLSVMIGRKDKDTVRLFYRVSDEGGTRNANDSGWVALADPAKQKSDACTGGHVVRYPLDVTGKYIQYKVQLTSKNNPLTKQQTVARVRLAAQVPTENWPDPTSTPKPTPSASTNPDDSTGEGYVTIRTKYIVPRTTNDEDAPDPEPSSGVLLPGSPSPSAATTSPVATRNPNAANPICGSNEQTEEAANVPLSIKQLKANGDQGVVLEDQQTDEDGMWQGPNGNRETFPAGNYQVTFGDYNQEDFRLVALCDPENRNILNSQSSEADRKAVIRVVNGQTANLTALYGPRTNPHIHMEKYAIPTVKSPSGPVKVIRSIYPGQSFTYYITYENTGGEVAKDVLVRDVIPSQYDVNSDLAREYHEEMQFSPDPRGGTLVSLRLGDIAPGQKGSIRIPVTLNAEAFTGLTGGDSLFGQ